MAGEGAWLKAGFSVANRFFSLLLSLLLPGGRKAGAIGIIGGSDGPTAIFTATKRRPGLAEGIAKLIRFFRANDTVPIVISRTKLALVLVAGVIAPLVLGLSALVFGSNRR